jgi:hypothetical protein
MIARGGRLCEALVSSVQRTLRRTGSRLDVDQAVVGGLLVRLLKQTRALFGSAADQESETHLILSRSIGETAITLRWLVRHAKPDSFRRFRADSFVYFRDFLARARAEESTGTAETTARLIEEKAEHELAAAQVGWDDVPARSGSWGPDVRQRFETFKQGWVYETLFAGHSSYVHPSWHEIRTFHIACDNDGAELDMTCGGLAPIVAFVVGRLVAEACRDAAEFLPNDLDSDDLAEWVTKTVGGSRQLGLLFHDWAAAGGLDDDLGRNLPIPEFGDSVETPEH